MTTGHAAVYDAATGTELATFARRSTPAFANGIGLFLENGVLQARDATTYAARWSFAGASGTFEVPPLIAGDDVYVRRPADPRARPADRRGAVERQHGPATGVLQGMAIAQGTLVLVGGQPASPRCAPRRRGRAGPGRQHAGARRPRPARPAARRVDARARERRAHGGDQPQRPGAAATAPLADRIDARQAIVADGRVFAIGPIAARLNPDTGATLWRYPGGAERAAYDRGRLFLGTEDEGLSRSTPTRARSCGAPKTRHDRAGGRGRRAVPADGGASVVRYDPATGAELWRYLAATRTSPTRNRRTVSLDGPYVYPGGHLRDRVARHRRRWSRRSRTAPQRASVRAREPRPHVRVRARPVGPARRSTSSAGVLVNRMGSVAPPAVIGNLLVTSGGGVKAYEFPSWTPRWKYTERDPQSMAVPPLIVGRHVYFAYAERMLRALDVDTGRASGATRSARTRRTTPTRSARRWRSATGCCSCRREPDDGLRERRGQRIGAPSDAVIKNL